MQLLRIFGIITEQWCVDVTNDKACAIKPFSFLTRGEEYDASAKVTALWIFNRPVIILTIGDLKMFTNPKDNPFKTGV